VAQSFVYGDSLQASLVAIIVPDPDTFVSWAAAHDVQGSMPELCKNQKLITTLLQVLVSHGKASGLKGFENVRAIYLESEMFSVQNELLTPTFKLKRHDALKKYKPEIDLMYSKIKS
jgi:long-chain acyl-CoA synthetase